MSYLGVGSGAGRTMVINGDTHFGASESPMSSAQRTANPNLVTFPSVAGVSHKRINKIITNIRVSS